MTISNGDKNVFKRSPRLIDRERGAIEIPGGRVEVSDEIWDWVVLITPKFDGLYNGPWRSNFPNDVNKRMIANGAF